jgi:ubiquitin carboxyl-terminal hydrolase 25/28
LTIVIKHANLFVLDIEQEIKDKQTMISSQFADYKHLAYRLYAVFVHHGSVEFGHYYIYIYDFERNVWRKYNDNYVTEVHDLDEIFMSQDRQNPPTPYFLVYVNDTMKDRLASPLCREILESSQDNENQPDTEMTSVTERVTAPTAAEDVDMGPPAYDEICADKNISGTGNNHHIEDIKGAAGVEGSKATGGPSSKDTDFHDVQW